VKDDLSVADIYDELAEAYAARVETKPHNAYYERPATLSLLPDVKGKRVLDAGCGPGVYTGWLVNFPGLLLPLPHPTIRPNAMNSGPSGPLAPISQSPNLPISHLPISQFPTLPISQFTS
jgi:hypothetical protein